MAASDSFLFFKLLLFQMLIVWCGAKYVTNIKSYGDAWRDSSEQTGLRTEFLMDEGIDEEIKSSIRNFIHSGIHTRHNLDPAKTELTFPIKVSKHGELVSQGVDHNHNEHARSRRSIDQFEHEREHTLHYNLTIAGQPLRLDLRPAMSFINPATIVERHLRDMRTRKPLHHEAQGCHYKGEVRDHPGSSVAISTCDGMTGLLRTHIGDYWIEPSNFLPEDDPQSPRPHVIYKRSAVDNNNIKHHTKRAINSAEHKKYRNEYLNHHRRINNRFYSQKLNFSRNNIAHSRNNIAHSRNNTRRYDDRRNVTSLYRNEHLRARSRIEARISEPRIRDGYRNSIESGDKTIRERIKNQRARQYRRRNKHVRRRKRQKNCGTKQPNRMEMQRKLRARRSRLERYERRHPRDADSSYRARIRKSVSKPRHVEVLLVADRGMAEFHGEDIEVYLMTIMNMVSSLYLSPSIGNFIQVVVVKIIIAERPGSDGFSTMRNAEDTLNSFCGWQKRINPSDDSDPHHHDVAILITRTDICSNKDSSCSTLGVARVGGMCNRSSSCSVNEDNGIVLAHTITHELGHNFGLFHDTEKIGCQPREGGTLHIMTPIFAADTIEVAWSRCSRRDVTNFLDAGMGDCLVDKPTQNYTYSNLPAGQLYGSTRQCQLQYGSDNAVACPGEKDVCNYLWCEVNNTCLTTMRPVADGTPCGNNMWCENRKCVPRTPRPRPEDGGWGEWSAWSECSRTCGGGVSVQIRHCDNPTPKHNGNFCTGERARYNLCNTHACPLNEPSFRHIQCSKHDNTDFENTTVAKWIPYFDQETPCRLICATPDQSKIVPFGEFAEDGTPCNPGTNDMCISGRCVSVGCDWKLESTASFDKCGVCGGDGNSCDTVHGIYSKASIKQSGYSEVALIPAGSRNVRVEESAKPNNFIGISSADSKRFYFSGKRNGTESIEYFVAGTVAMYERNRDKEEIRIPGPINEDIKIYQMLVGGEHRNPGVSYEYVVDKTSERQYRWRVNGYTPCSATCNGYKRLRIECYDDTGRQVSKERCENQQDLNKPTDRVEHCSPSCEDNFWWVGTWSSCNQICTSPGRPAYKQRSVYCLDRQTNQFVNDIKCERSMKPVTKTQCYRLPPCDRRY